MIEKDVQKRILKAISTCGGTANTNEIMEIANLQRFSVHSGTRHLVSRALIKKHPRRMKENGKGDDKSIFSLRDNPIIMAKIKRLISEIEE